MQIGFKGGQVIEPVDSEIGMNNFFLVVKKVVMPEVKNIEWSIFFDRFYKRYIRENEFEKIKIIMDIIANNFSEKPATIAIDILGPDNELENKTLKEFYTKYFEVFYYCYKHAVSFIDYYKDMPNYKYIPFQIFVAEMPSFIGYRGITLAEFDALPDDALPIWLTGELP